MSERSRSSDSISAISRVCRDAKSRSISPENPTGEKGKGGMAEEGTGAVHARGLGRGWKISPSKRVAPGETLLLGEIDGSGAIQQIWITPAKVAWRDLILRIYWDDQSQPSVEAPLGDFFACGWGRYAQVSSLAVCVNPGRAFNCYWEMPFRKRARLTLENRDPEAACGHLLADQLRADRGSRGRRLFPCPVPPHEPTALQGRLHVLEGVAAAATTSALIRVGRQQLPAGGAKARSSFSSTATNGPRSVVPVPRTISAALTISTQARSIATFPRAYLEFTTPYSGMPQVIRPDGTYQSQQRFGLYRWHIMDPIRFETDLRVTLQAIGWRTEKEMQKRRYLPLQDDIASVAYWYQTLPTAPFPALPDRDYLEII